VVPPFVMRGVSSPTTWTASEHFAGNVFVWDAEHRAKIHINSLGLRDREMTVEKADGVTRIALMGNSFVEALQVEQSDTFDDRSEEIFRKSGREVEVVNLAISGQTAIEQLVRLEDVGVMFDSDIVVTITRALDFTSGEMRSDTKWPGYVAGPSGDLVRGDNFKLSFARRHANDWKGKALSGALRYSNIARMLNSAKGKSYRQILGLERTGAPGSVDACSAAEISELHELWVNHSSPENWAATQKYFQEYSSIVDELEAVPIYAFREIPIPAGSCVDQIVLRSELIQAAESYIVGLGIKFVDWDVALQDSDVLKVLGPTDITVLQGFGRELGVGHYNFDGHQASAEILTNSVQFALP